MMSHVEGLLLWEALLLLANGTILEACLDLCFVELSWTYPLEGLLDLSILPHLDRDLDESMGTVLLLFCSWISSQRASFGTLPDAIAPHFSSKAS